ncbi:hypothetical protein Daura_17255 [Dactylosporangium aurantiacum]|uniref:Uncharacterized protein n=1 Tax=Dactylosporangium aurantiacum TaxID=35754 RepID=A0A9Q9IQ10_9ACTN|nr:hypothetical protein [Dactylosporangium aurantiacum]MDG6103255.1 hypothetical protein [Dactylosporangium aurantiacum]UWZ57757.1 hypothetical protein Daura_17255 [Dactylosporangium aurantiacum]
MLEASIGVRPHTRTIAPAGSALQYQTQAKRFASNGYPAALVEAHEYDSTFALHTLEQVWSGLDARIDRLLRAAGTDRVDLVAHYVNLDGRTATAPPGGVPTLAI